MQWLVGLYKFEDICYNIYMIEMITNGGKKRERELIEDLAHFCVKKLIPRKKNLEVNISIKRNMIENEGMFAGAISILLTWIWIQV